MINSYRYRLASIQRDLENKTVNLPPEERHNLQKGERYYSEQIVDGYTRVLGCEKPMLKSIEVRGDPNNPLHMDVDVDLTGLPDEDLHALARILPKLGGATAPGDQAPPPKRRKT
jgi:hypothetical protein